MLRLRDSIAGERLAFYCVEDKDDCAKAVKFARQQKVLALDTESTGLDCYVPGWQLRMFQFGHATVSIVVPARFRRTIAAIMEMDIDWIAHNGPHDIRSIDQHLGYETGVVCRYETYIRAHHRDPRSRKDGGTGNGLKELSCAHIDRNADKWEKALKAAFKTIQVPMPGLFYKSGPRKGLQRYRAAYVSEGWALIDPKHPAYIAYAASDPVLTYRLWEHSNVSGWPHNKRLYRRDMAIQQICDHLQRRALPVDHKYTMAYSEALDRAIKRAARRLERQHGITSLYTNEAIAERFIALGAVLMDRTPKGAYKMDAKVLKRLSNDDNAQIARLATTILRAKQRTKRKKVYADGILATLDHYNRVHPAINSLAARTGRMSAGIFQQLPTKDETS